MRGKGINCDTGFLPGEHDSRPDLDPAAVAAEIPSRSGICRS